VELHHSQCWCAEAETQCAVPCHALHVLTGFLTLCFAGIILPIVVPPIRQRFSTREPINPPPVKQVLAQACL